MWRRNWAHHVNSFLIEEIKEYQEKGSQAVKGWHFVLQIIYFKERYEGNNLNDPNAPPPWIQRWCGDNLKEKIRAEDEDITGLIQRAKMRARKKKEDRKGQKGKDKVQTEESDSLGSESGEGSEEEEYQTMDSEPEPEPEVLRERRLKKKEDDSVIHQRQKIEREERSKRRREDRANKEREPTLARQFDHLAKKRVQSKEVPSKKKKTGPQRGATNSVQPQKDIPVQAEAEPKPPKKKAKTSATESDINPEQPQLDIPVQASTIPEPEAEEEQAIQFGPQPQPEPIMYVGPQPQAESNIEGGPEVVIYFGPEPAELLDGYVAECERAEKIFEKKMKEAEAEIKACNEAEAHYKTKRTTGEGIGDDEIDLAIRRATEGVLSEGQEMEKQEREAAPLLIRWLLMVASVATGAVEYDPSKAFDLGFTQPQPQEESAELYDLDDFPDETGNPITPVFPPRVNEITQDLKNGCVAWALTKKNDNKYNMLFEFNGE
ncbi:hypothetical protein PIB30_046951 [Stylosanthes scabra]|uniref:Uncharacterized protein n=1 Tax=Stylosanthes scabra TaxID=79078 RepID=A0ABU6RGN1_9FABA|nr:hypothetical protein [Stylosanthes scabra]